MTTLALDPLGGSRFPWKSLNDRIWMFIRGPLGPAMLGLLVPAMPTPAAIATVRTPTSRRERTKDNVRKTLRLLLVRCDSAGAAKRGPGYARRLRPSCPGEDCYG